MLKEIKCDKFIESPIIFGKGLNVVLGDNFSTNSIGKSMFLMITDFVFGGNSYSTIDSGAQKNIGHQTFYFKFEFKHDSKYYSRNTENPEIITVCDKDYNALSEIDKAEYTSQLKMDYEIDCSLSFRQIVNPFSRIWGKENYNVNEPLRNSIKESPSAPVVNIIKLFKLYQTLEELNNEIKTKVESKRILNGAQKKEYIAKTTKTEFKKNALEIERINQEIADIKNNLLKYTVNIEELTSKELIELKTQKSRLLKSQSLILNKIKRLDLNLSSKSVKSKYFTKLSTFFENPNEEKINEIESFHNKISKILERELLAAKAVLVTENEGFQAELKKLDLKIAALLENVNSPKFIVDKIYELTIEASKLNTANKFYEEKQGVAKSIKDLNENLDDTIADILKEIEEKINGELIRINNEIHPGKKKIPVFKLNRKSYSFDHSGNTGTGKSFADLIEFDLSILKLTELPFVIHDSVLFKNIEDMSIDKIIEQYQIFDKQIFMALDGINKFDDATQSILKDKAVLSLTEERKLFNKDWR
ncbi:hypothetical protein DF185_22265 [Marinifilum breve]|uniref:DUF2326 domain-containing protein n=1 Tax=Marinifilum breve TaxID=2184082 RepID=A0A2V3ZRX8_9BACT|nr:DUF2326 domain-containing protein [Marinifilum breve]PXX95444.1 hypothetical protein DF185_22265 [Marinifilum breve]